MTPAARTCACGCGQTVRNIYVPGHNAIAQWRDTVTERFWANVGLSAPEGCWLWTGLDNGEGYGRIYSDQEAIPAHRFAYELAWGTIPTGLTVDHLCEVTMCVNPNHLEPVTRAENSRRARLALTACKNQHPYADGAFVVDNRGYRNCLTCFAERQKRCNAAKRARRAARKVAA